MPDPIGDLANLTKLILRLPTEAQALFTIARSGMIGPERPDKVLAMIQAFERYGALGAAPAVAAIRYGNRAAIADERGILTFAEVDSRANALANALSARGVKAGMGIGVLCRNHRGIFDATFASLKLGARALYLNTDFAGPQAKEVCAREGVEALVYDEEFAAVVSGVDAEKGRYLAWTDVSASETNEPTLESLISAGNPAAPPSPSEAGRIVILTSGTTGTPKGANRDMARSLVPPAAMLSRIPFRAKQATCVTSPVFHAWGLGMSTLALALGSTVVVRRRFDPEATLLSLAEHRCTALTVVPVILNRLVAVGENRIAEIDLSSLRIIASSGAQLEGALATRSMDVFGDILYNLYGSTEVAYATIATPEDMRAAPGCAGKPPLGTTVRIFSPEGNRLANGETGRIFVGSGMEFSGYTGGGGKDMIEGLMATGDVGHFDEAGRLFVDGRDDEMIVSGGENVFPREVEELLASHGSIVEAAAIGVDDDSFGQRLRAFVVLKSGRELTVEDVQEFVKSNLARYKVPRDVIFIEQLPRNPSGKVLKRALSEIDEDD